MSFDDLEPWEETTYSQGESDESESPEDDLEGDPSYTYRGQVTIRDRNTRNVTRLANIRLSPTNPGTSRETIESQGTMAPPVEEDQTEGSASGGSRAVEHEALAEKLTLTIGSMSNAFKVLTDQGK